MAMDAQRRALMARNGTVNVVCIGANLFRSNETIFFLKI